MFIYSPHAILDQNQISYIEKNYDVQSVGSKVITAGLIGAHGGTTTSAETVLDLIAPYDMLLLDWSISTSPSALSTLTDGQVQLTFSTGGINQNPFISNGTSVPFDSRFIFYDVYRFNQSRFMRASNNFKPILIKKEDRLYITAVVMAIGGAATSFELSTGVMLTFVPVIIK